MSGSPQRTASGSPAGSSSPRHVEVLVVGAGPGGYTAAFRAADLGKQVLIVERHEALGGVCLNVGCIPSKTLLHVAEVMNDARDLAGGGIAFDEPRVDLERLRAYKQRVVSRLTRGLAGLAQQRGVTVVRGTARFAAPDRVAVESAEGVTQISFDDAIIAAGSRSMELPVLPRDEPRLLDSTRALELAEVPGRLLVVGGGIIGLEMATFFQALGSAITVVELTDELMPGCDRDLVQPLQRRLSRRTENVFLGTRVSRVEREAAGLRVWFEGASAPASDVFDRVLVAVGRRPNSDRIGAEAAGLEVDDRGFLAVDAHRRTNQPHIFAVGDLTGPPMLAHKATHEGRVAAEVIAGLPAAFDTAAIPAVAYTDPEIAWVGLTENDARERGIAFEKGAFPWSASGRALSMGRSDGVTKVLVDPESRRILGAGIAGRHAGELIAEAVLAIEMGADAEDVGLSIHAHPTLSETFGIAAEVVEGSATDLPPRTGPSRERSP